MQQAYEVTRDITREECHWIRTPVPAGTVVYRFVRPTYGCIGPDGQAVTLDPFGDYPFFELPIDALKEKP